MYLCGIQSDQFYTWSDEYPERAHCRLTKRSEGPGEVRHASGLAAGCQGRHGAAQETGRVAGARFPSAAASLIEGLEEGFTINRLDVPASRHRCLATTNVIESPHGGVRLRTRGVCRAS